MVTRPDQRRKANPSFLFGVGYTVLTGVILYDLIIWLFRWLGVW